MVCSPVLLCFFYFALIATEKIAMVSLKRRAGFTARKIF
jgi:hypothetical protein